MVHRKLSIITSISLLVFGVTASACAEEEDYTSIQEGDAILTLSDYFSAADLDGDDALNGDEFKLFIDALAEAGNTDAASVRDNDEYDAQFEQNDTNADGVVSFEESPI